MAGPNEWQQVCSQSNPEKLIEVVKGRILAWLSSKVSRILNRSYCNRGRGPATSYRKYVISSSGFLQVQRLHSWPCIVMTLCNLQQIPYQLSTVVAGSLQEAPKFFIPAWRQVHIRAHIFWDQALSFSDTCNLYWSSRPTNREPSVHQLERIPTLGVTNGPLPFTGNNLKF